MTVCLASEAIFHVVESPGLRGFAVGRSALVHRQSPLDAEATTLPVCSFLESATTPPGAVPTAKDMPGLGVAFVQLVPSTLDQHSG